jgi:hypothetical protein
MNHHHAMHHRIHMHGMAWMAMALPFAALLSLSLSQTISSVLRTQLISEHQGSHGVLIRLGPLCMRGQGPQNLKPIPTK